MHAKLLQLCLTLQPHRLRPRQAPLSIKLFRQEYWSGLTFPPPGDLPQIWNRTWISCIAGRFFTNQATREPS